VIHKLFAFAALDTEICAEVDRSERQRRQSLSHLAVRLVAAGYTVSKVDDAAELLASLTSFRAFEAFTFDAGPRRAERRLLHLARAALGHPRREDGVE
jgi:hypothetical protein